MVGMVLRSVVKPLIMVKVVSRSAVIGDVNGDGLNDMLIGAYAWQGSKGRSYVVFGGADVGSVDC